jgi:2-iminobutanoate/2-iminopropanoate deaminase
MEGRAVQPAGVATPKAPYSPVVVSGDLVLIAGQVGFDENGDLVSDEIVAQARQVFDNLRRCLEAAGSSLDEVVKVNAFLADFADFEAYNEVYRQHFSVPFPVRTTVQAGLAPGLRIEVEGIARSRS